MPPLGVPPGVPPVWVEAGGKAATINVAFMNPPKNTT